MRRVVPQSLGENNVLQVHPCPPPDKSLLHRLLFFSSVARSTTRIRLPEGVSQLPGDVETTITVLKQLGVTIERKFDTLIITGIKHSEFKIQNSKFNCGNSGTTARLLMGLLAGTSDEVTITGDQSLSRRPMGRLADLLNDAFGSRIATSPDGTLPVTLFPAALHAAHDAKLPVASAQIETALTLAALGCDEPSTFERTPARNHTRPMLRLFGVRIEESDNKSGSWQTIYPSPLVALRDEYLVPCDISAASFWLVLTAITGRKIVLDDVLVSPSRTGILDILRSAGCGIVLSDVKENFGERVATISCDARDRELHCFDVSDELTLRSIDELPFVAMLAAAARGTSTIRDAGELRFKESDRLAQCENVLEQLGSSVEKFSDGFRVTPRAKATLQELSIDTQHDHRIAMAGVLAAFVANVPVIIDDTECVSVSYPDFWDDVAHLLQQES